MSIENMSRPQITTHSVYSQQSLQTQRDIILIDGGWVGARRALLTANHNNGNKSNRVRIHLRCLNESQRQVRVTRPDLRAPPTERPPVAAQHVHILRRACAAKQAEVISLVVPARERVKGADTWCVQTMPPTRPPNPNGNNKPNRPRAARGHPLALLPLAQQQTNRQNKHTLWPSLNN